MFVGTLSAIDRQRLEVGPHHLVGSLGRRGRHDLAGRRLAHPQRRLETLEGNGSLDQSGVPERVRQRLGHRVDTDVDTGDRVSLDVRRRSASTRGTTRTRETCRGGSRARRWHRHRARAIRDRAADGRAGSPVGSARSAASRESRVSPGRSPTGRRRRACGEGGRAIAPTRDRPPPPRPAGGPPACRTFCPSCERVPTAATHDLRKVSDPLPQPGRLGISYRVPRLSPVRTSWPLSTSDCNRSTA